MKTLASFCFAAAGVLLVTKASAQVLNPSRFDDYSDLVHAGFGVDPALNVDAGYVHSLTPLGDEPWVIGSRLSLPFVPEGADFEAVLLSQIGFLLPSHFGVSPRLELGVRNAHTLYVNATDIGFHLDVSGGYFGERVMTAAELAWEKPIASYMYLTDRYREQVYPDARSGLYGGGGGFFRLGLALGVRLFASSDLTLRTGIVRSEHLRSVDFLPFYAQLGFNQAF